MNEETRPTMPPGVTLEDVYRTVALSSPVAAVAADADGRMLFLNPAAEKLLNCPAQVAEQVQQFSDFLHDARELHRIREALLESGGTEITRELKVRGLGGDVVPVRALFRGLCAPERGLTLMVGFFEDQRETEGLFQRLEQATRQLIEGERRFEALEKGRILAHELNQPLTVAMGSLEIMAANVELPEGVRNRIDRVYDQLQRMARMVRRLSGTGRWNQEAPPPDGAAG